MHTNNDPNDFRPSFQWFSLVPGTEELEQGDFLDDFPVIIPTATLENAEQREGKYQLSATVQKSNVVIMTQSCDLNNKLGDDAPIILCPRFSLNEAKIGGKSLNNPDSWGHLRKGNLVSAYLTNKCEIASHEFNYQVIDLSRVFSAPFFLVKNLATSKDGRIRLLPPYREHLSQSFARQFMRIGLPIDLPPKYPF